jgi:hypothetical protein
VDQLIISLLDDCVFFMRSGWNLFLEYVKPEAKKMLENAAVRVTPGPRFAGWLG